MGAVPPRLPGEKPTRADRWVEIAEIVAFIFCLAMIPVAAVLGSMSLVAICFRGM
jgi:hypothetical protein